MRELQFALGSLVSCLHDVRQYMASSQKIGESATKRITYVHTFARFHVSTS